MHVGETITFAGEFWTDHIERAGVRPNGCDRFIHLREVSPEADKVLMVLDGPVYRIEAIFTGTIVFDGERAEWPPDMWIRDDGVRLNISRITDVKIIDPDSH
jgi:hypothetical protein